VLPAEGKIRRPGRADQVRPGLQPILLKRFGRATAVSRSGYLPEGPGRAGQVGASWQADCLVRTAESDERGRPRARCNDSAWLDRVELDLDGGSPRRDRASA
jgi:hypothetical protein